MATTCPYTVAADDARRAEQYGLDQHRRTGGRAALMRNIWIVLVVLIALLGVTRLLRYQQDTQRICADNPSASVCGRKKKYKSSTAIGLRAAACLSAPYTNFR